MNTRKRQWSKNTIWTMKDTSNLENISSCILTGKRSLDRISVDRNCVLSLDRNCVLSLDRNYVNHLIEFFDTFHLIELFDQLNKKN